MSSKHAWSDQKVGFYELGTEICLGQLEQGTFCSLAALTTSKQQGKDHQQDLHLPLTRTREEKRHRSANFLLK